MLHGVKLAQNHAVFNALRLQRNDLFVFRNCLVQDIGRRRSGRGGVLALTQLTQINASQQLVGIHIVGRGLEQIAGCDFCIVGAAGAEVEVGQAVIQLRRTGIGVEREFVLLNGARNQLGAAFGDSIFLVDIGERKVVVSGCTVSWCRSRVRSGRTGCRSRGVFNWSSWSDCAGRSLNRLVLRARRGRWEQDQGSCGDRKRKRQGMKVFFHHPEYSAPCKPVTGGKPVPEARKAAQAAFKRNSAYCKDDSTR